MLAGVLVADGSAALTSLQGMFQLLEFKGELLRKVVVVGSHGPILEHMVGNAKVANGRVDFLQALHRGVRE